MNKIMLKGKIFLLMLVTLVCVSACDDDDDDGPALTVETFMQQAAASDMFELSTGNMAVTKGTTADVKAFGQKLIDDHTTSSTELKTLASLKKVTLPTTMPADKNEKVMRLQGLSGTAFDKEFSSIQVDAHEDAVELFQKADRDISDADVQAFVDKTLPVLRMHLDHAEDLEDKTH